MAYKYKSSSPYLLQVNLLLVLHHFDVKVKVVDIIVAFVQEPLKCNESLLVT